MPRHRLGGRASLSIIVVVPVSNLGSSNKGGSHTLYEPREGQVVSPTPCLLLHLPTHAVLESDRTGNRGGHEPARMRSERARTLDRAGWLALEDQSRRAVVSQRFRRQQRS